MEVFSKTLDLRKKYPGDSVRDTLESGESRSLDTIQSVAIVKARDDESVNYGTTAYWKDFEKQ